MMLNPVAATPSASPVTEVTVRAPRPGPSAQFHELLSELNPLQYVPVVGTIYRSLTGDTIPETARIAGSLVVSGLTGGPIGVAINLAALAVEKTLGIDPEKLGGSILADIGLGPAAPATATATSAAPTLRLPALQKAAPFSPTMLAAAGVTTTATGELRRGQTTGCDVLNELELNLKTLPS